MTIHHIAAIDLGASSGRVMLARYDALNATFFLSEVHRFTNKLHCIEGQYCWDLDHLVDAIVWGLTHIVEQGIVLDSIGIDTWGVDYVLLDSNGQRVGPSYAYRDHRTEGVMTQVLQDMGKNHLYQKTGIQFLPFNTLYQLKAMMDAPPADLSQVTDWLMIPDYLNYRLTGQLCREYTNATTTQLLNVNTGDWDESLLQYIGVPKTWFGTITQPGQKVGYWQAPIGQPIPVLSVASHDTASAVIATPIACSDSAYLCSGTWSLMGLERIQPCTCEQALVANFTNEGGGYGHYRVLKNMMGLWLFQRICDENKVVDVSALVADAAQEPAFRSVVQPNADCFLNPKSMTATIQKYCEMYQYPIPKTLSQLARCVFDSLALLYRQVADELGQLHGRPLRQIHVVGGGCQNDFLNQLCADVCGIPVLAGPVEASTLGNIGSQLITLNAIKDMHQYRQLIIDHFPVRHFLPAQECEHEQHWQRFCELRQLEEKRLTA